MKTSNVSCLGTIRSTSCHIHISKILQCGRRSSYFATSRLAACQGTIVVSNSDALFVCSIEILWSLHDKSSEHPHVSFMYCSSKSLPSDQSNLQQSIDSVEKGQVRALRNNKSEFYL
jgi:hypothetical protein